MGHRALKQMDEWIAINSIEPPASTPQTAAAAG
jgi:hypothetical protein